MTKGGKKKETLWGKVEVRCRLCNSIYFVGRKELKRKTDANHGYYPCDKCGSHATTWEL